MKKCPTCENVYKNEMQFCPNDGTKLISSRNSRRIYPGQVLKERYEIKQTLDSQGLWKVFLAQEISTSQSVIIKSFSLLDEGDNVNIHLLESRLKRLKNLSHPGIIKILEYGKNNENLFYVITEYVQGETLKTLIDDIGSITFSVSFSILKEVITIVNFMHHNGLLHLHLHPTKIFLVKNTIGNSFVKIDAIGRCSDFSPEVSVPKNNQFVSVQNANNYTAPEIFSGKKPDIRSDIYSIGVIGYEILSGILPFPPGVVLFHKSAPAPPINKVKPFLKIPKATDKAILKAIQHNPTKRFQSTKLFLDTFAKSKKKWTLKKIAIMFFLFLFLGYFYESSLDFCYYCFDMGTSFFKLKTNEKIAEKKKTKIKELSKQDKKKLLEENFKKKKAFLKKHREKRKNSFENMILIKGGKIIRGTYNGEEDEAPIIIKIDNFYIDSTEVTNKKYQLFVIKTGHKAPIHWKKGVYPEKTGKYPVVNVNWYSASLYATWKGKRLPLETEWELAARGTGKQATRWPWGNKYFHGYSNVATGKLQPIKMYPQGKSSFGIFDMAGNVLEWTNSWYDVEIKQDRVIRGGSFKSTPFQARTTYRDGFFPLYYRNDIGFRCVKDKKE